MINGKNKDLYYESSIHKQLNIEIVGTKAVIDNSMRERDTFTLTETLNDGSELKFGSCLPNQISFTAHDVPAGIIGKKLRPVETLEGNEDDPFVYGEYKIYSDTPTADRTKRQIVAYDAMYDILNADVKAWYDGLSFPLTLKAFRDSFFAYLGIAQADTSLVNDGMTVNKTLTTSSSDDSAVTAEASVSGKTIIEAICEINGAFGNINRDGKFEYVILPNIISAVYPAQDLFPSRTLFPAAGNTESMNGHYITFDYENFKSKAITQLEIRADDNTAGALVGTAGNNYVISGNFLVSDKTGAELEQIANNVFPIMKQAAYTPIKSSTCVGNPCLELGDPIRFNTSREIVETYLLQRTLTGVQSKRDSISAQGTQTHSAKVNSIRDTIESVERRTGKLERNADHLQSTYEDLEEQTSSKFEQTADAITAEVTRAQGAEGNLSSQISIVAGEVSSKVSRGDIVSEINQTADTISLRAGHLEIDCNNFQVDKDTGDAKIGGTLSFYEDFSESHSGEIQYGKLPGGGSMGFNMNDSLNVSGNIYMNQSLVAKTSDLMSYVKSVGTASWSEIWSNSWVVTSFSLSIIGSSIYVSGNHIKKDLSDQRLKEYLGKLDERYADFYKMLNPIIFKFHDDIPTIKGKHFGLYANEVADALDKANIDRSGLRLVWQSEVDSEAHEDRYVNDKTWNLDYDELHALHIYMIQNQQKEIEQLKSDNFALKGEVDILKQRLEKMEEMLNVINSKIN